MRKKAKSLKNKGAIRIITYIVIAIALSTSAFADVNMTDETDGISPKAFGRINHTVSPYTLAVGNSFNLEAGETVEFNCVYTPRTEEIEFGLIVPDGTFRYELGNDGVFSLTFRVQETGKYTIAMYNRSSVPIEVTGYVYY